MDTNFSVEDESFRSSVRVFLKENLPARLAAKVRDGQPLTKNDQEEWHAILHRRGWPRILDGSDWWCQGFSEPGAGSDLAALKMSAKRVRDGSGEYYLVNGQKTWTTQAQYANMIFCLARTSPEAQRQVGISFLLVDMSTPGVEVRPIITLDGGHEINEVFFSNVRVPLENLVGEENKGWTYAKYLLTLKEPILPALVFPWRHLHV